MDNNNVTKGFSNNMIPHHNRESNFKTNLGKGVKVVGLDKLHSDFRHNLYNCRGGKSSSLDNKPEYSREIKTSIKTVRRSSRDKSVNSQNRSRSGKRKFRHDQDYRKTDDYLINEKDKRVKLQNTHIRKSPESPQVVNNFSQPIKSQYDDIHFRSCYFIGIPMNIQGNHIYQELSKRRIDYPDKFDIINKSN